MHRRAAVDLVAQPADEDVHGAVAVALAPAPDLLQQLVAGDDAAALERELVEQPELGRREPGVAALDVRLHVARVDAELLDLDRVAALLRLRAHAPPGRGADAGDELLHRERLDEVVVGPDLERVHAVVLGAAGADRDDRRPDPLGAGLLDQAPAVEAGQHHVEHEHVGLLVAEAGEALLAARHPQRVEPGGAELAHDPLCDDVVVLDDQHLGHSPVIMLIADGGGGSGW